MIVAGEDDGLNFPGQLESVAIAADAVVVADAGSDIPGANRGISLSGIPGMGFMSDGIHLHTAQLRIHFSDICLQILVDRRNIFIGDAGDVKGLPGTKMEIAVTPGLGDMFHIAEILGIYRAARHTHLKHKFSGHFGLPVAVQPKLFDIDILMHPFSVYQIPSHHMGEYRTVQTNINLVNAAMAALPYCTGHLPFEAHPNLLRSYAMIHKGQTRELHHGRRTYHHDCVIVTKGIKGNLGYESSDHTRAPTVQCTIW